MNKKNFNYGDTENTEIHKEKNSLLKTAGQKEKYEKYENG
jgi:hypothetical protein